MKGLFADVNPEHVFMTKDGAQIKNLRELENKVANMSDEVFMHHVNEGRNDFHNWVNDIYGDQTLATMLMNAKTKADVVRHVRSRLNEEVTKMTREVKSIISAKDKSAKAEYLKKMPAKLKENNEKAIEKAVENVANKRPKAKENSMDEGALAAFMQLTENAMKREAQEEQQKTNMKENTTFMRLGIADFAIGIGIGAIAGLIVSSFMR